MQSIKTLQEFDAVKSATKTIAVSSGERSHRQRKKAGWKAIRVQLANFWGADKTQLTTRWAALQSIHDLCAAYKGEKETTERSGNRAVFAETLGNQAIRRLNQEKGKATNYGFKVNEVPITDSATRRSPGKAVGGQNQAHGDVRFERAMPQGSVYHGKQVADQAQGKVELVGDDLQDAYALRALVKKMEKEGLYKDFQKAYKIPYFTDTERTAHQVTIQSNQLTWQGSPLSTPGIKGPEKGVSDHQAMYAIGQGGAIYVRKDIKKFNHSCFTAGDSVICAGMITALNGRLIHISNGSGHYGPGMNELLDACDVFAESPYVDYSDAYVLYMDFANLYGRGGAKEYRIPFQRFLQANGMVVAPQRYEATVKDFEYAYSYVDPRSAYTGGARIHPQLAPT